MKTMKGMIITVALALALASCGAGKSDSAKVENAGSQELVAAAFDADSAYSYLARQVEFGPRVPNSDAHRQCGQWLVSELKRHGAEVTGQRATLEAFDGTKLDALNIFAQYNPTAPNRTLLLAHWDCRPWADQDSDPAKHSVAVDGANDGASGVAVILEIARQLNREAPKRGVDILFVDAEDWGSENDEDSWALGARYFMEHKPEGYSPDEAILLDMVGGEGAVFHREYFSEQSAPDLAAKIWGIADGLGYGSLFVNKMGGAINDDHVQTVAGGIPTIDIIEYNPENPKGFNPRWHTAADNLDGISAATLRAVGETVHTYLRR